MDWKTVLGFTIAFHAIVYAWRREWILRLDTRRLNGPINSVAESGARKYLRMWFRLGTYATLILGFPFTIFLFLRTISYSIFPSIMAVAVAVTPSSLLPPDQQQQPLELHHEPLSPFPDADLGIEVDSNISGGRGSSGYLAIQPILPGWNLPLSQLPYYLLAILISVVIHELGHALASASHKIPIQSVGVSIFGPLIPAAHVELNSVTLRESPLKKQLDILTAGVWMNVYLALVTYFIVPKLIPALLWPTHSSHSGLTVTNVFQSSGIGGPGGLLAGDVIIGIENCPVADLDSWYTCLEKIWGSDPVGYCVTDDVLIGYANNSEGCCASGKDTSPTHLCFLQMDDPPPLPKTLDEDKNSSASATHKALEANRTSHCLPAQPVVRQSSTDSLTMSSPDASAPFTGWEGRCHAPLFSCPKNSEGQENHCYLPRLVRELSTSFRIVEIRRRQSDLKSPVLFVGNVMDMDGGLRASEYVPRSWFLSSFLGFCAFAKFPEKLETVLLLTAGLSAGLAVVNMLPIYGLDGYHIVDAVVRAHFGAKAWEARRIGRLVQLISWIAVGIAALTIFCSLAQAL